MNPRGEDGSATVHAVTGLGVLITVTMLAAAACGLVVAHREAEAAADLTALAGASALQHGDDPCTSAGRIASANRAVLGTCEVRGEVVTVEVAVEVVTVFRTPWTLGAAARAGPTR